MRNLQRNSPQGHDLTYYTTQAPIRLREFGRGIEKMLARIEQCENPDLRLAMIKETVRVMATIAPQTRDQADYRVKLWEHLTRLAGPDGLGVEPPFEIKPYSAKLEPVPVPYYSHLSRFPQYGKNVELMIEKALAMEPGDTRDAYVQQIANIMKQLLLNRDANLPPDQVVVQHLNMMSGGKIQLDPDGVSLRILAGPMPAPPPRSKGKKKKKKGAFAPQQPPQPAQPNPNGGGGNNRKRGRNNRRGRGGFGPGGGGANNGAGNNGPRGPR